MFYLLSCSKYLRSRCSLPLVYTVTLTVQQMVPEAQCTLKRLARTQGEGGITRKSLSISLPFSPSLEDSLGPVQMRGADSRVSVSTLRQEEALP